MAAVSASLTDEEQAGKGPHHADLAYMHALSIDCVTRCLQHRHDAELKTQPCKLSPFAGRVKLVCLHAQITASYPLSIQTDHSNLCYWLLDPAGITGFITWWPSIAVQQSSKELQASMQACQEY